MAVTTEDLQKIITTTLDYDVFITMANDILSGYPCIAAYPESIQDNITKYLAAHFISMSDNSQLLSKEKIDTAEETYFQTTNSATFKDWGALAMTKYGMQVKIFDYNNCLQDLGKDKFTPVFESI